MEEAIIQVGLPVRCRYGDCEAIGRVKPSTDYGGWYKSRLLRKNWRKRWFCPDHAADGKAMDDRFYQTYATPEAVPTPEDVTEDLYKLLED